MIKLIAYLFFVPFIVREKHLFITFSKVIYSNILVIHVVLRNSTFLQNNFNWLIWFPSNKCTLFSLGTSDSIFVKRLGIALNGCQCEEQESADSEDLHFS